MYCTQKVNQYYKNQNRHRLNQLEIDTDWSGSSHLSLFPRLTHRTPPPFPRLTVRGDRLSPNNCPTVKPDIL